jgi:hypothetical protein
MDGTGEPHSESGQPGLEDQKSYVLLHMQTLDLGQNAAMWLDLHHMTRGVHIREIYE